MNQQKPNRIAKISLLLIVVIFAGFIFGEIWLPSDQPKIKNSCKTYSGKWERVRQDGTYETVKIPGECAAERNEVVTLQTVLPRKIKGGQYMCFRSAKQDMRFFVDGKLRQQYSTRESRIFGKMSAVTYVFVEISEKDEGKTMRVETQTDSSYSGIFYKVYIGTPMGVWNKLFKNFGMELIVAFITLVLSIIAIGASVAFRLCYHKRMPLEYLGFGILIAAMWLITNSVFRQLMFPNISLVNDMTFLMIMLLALPYLFYMNAIQNRRYERGYDALEKIVMFNFVVCAGLHMMGICDYTDTIGYISAFCVVCIFWIFITIFLDIKRKKMREYTFVAIGIFGACLAAVFQIFFYFQRSNLFNGVILALGLIVLLLFSTINTIQEIVMMDREKQQAMSASEAKGRFLANMSHEIRTPIHAVLGMDEMILRESGEEKIREYAMDIRNAGQTLLSLINDVLDISKIESGKLEILPVEYDVSSLLLDIVNMMKMKAQSKELDFVIHVNERIPCRLFGDDVRLRQILVNLLSNAIKYTEQGSVALEVDFDENLQGSDQTVELVFRVRDTGIGIREEDLEQLFTAFERLDEKRNRKIEGTGLGMSITTQLLEMMGSQLEVESEYGKGSVFSFRLTQDVINSEPVGNLGKRIADRAAEYEYQTMFTAPEARILLVDDNVVNRRVVVQLLKETKVQVEEVSSGEQCLECVEKNSYDLIFLDHMMPGMDGIETLQEMRRRENGCGKDVPVIALTANAVTGAREMYLQAGFADFLAKPVKPEKLEKLLMDMLPAEKVNLPKNVNSKNVKEIQEEGIPEIEGINWEFAKQYCKDKNIWKDTLRQFAVTMEQEAQKLEKQYDYLCQLPEKAAERHQAFHAYCVQVHSMKGAAAMAGAVTLSGVARMLEFATKENNGKRVRDVTPHFIEEWREMKSRLLPLFADGEPAEKRVLESSTMRTLLSILKNAVEEMDVDQADEIIQQLKEVSLPSENMQQALVSLCAAVTDLDQKEVVTWCDRLEELYEEYIDNR